MADEEGVISKIWGKFEDVYGALGRMSPGDESSPAKRLVFTAGVATVAVFSIKPQISFTSSGEMRPWVVTDPNNTEATHFPWWMIPVAAGFFGGFLV